MKLIKQQVEVIPQGYDFSSLLKHVEICGRVCYKSEDKITEDSYNRFYNMIISRGHLSVLEHATVYLTLPTEDEDAIDVHEFADTNPYSKWCLKDNTLYVTTNLRVLIENNLLKTYQNYLSEPTEHLRRTTYRFITSIGIAREITRHRILSFSQESTRYVNYNKKELQFIIPEWFYDATEEQKNIFKASLEHAEQQYNTLSSFLTPENCRDILPLCTKTELICTGFDEDWKVVKKLRTHSSAHPSIIKLFKNIL